MKIAQVSPLYESVPPKSYGGTERVVSYLTEELVAQGHDVTLFASGDSKTKARLISPCKRSLRTDPSCTDPIAHHVLMLEQIAKLDGEFDIVHYHVDYLHYHWSRRQRRPHVTTLHGRLDLPHLVPLYREFREVPVVSISNAQRRPLPWINWRGTVYHGLSDDLHTFRAHPDDYLAFVGRISPEKGLDHAIEIAGRTGMNLKIAAKVDRADREYFERSIEPLLCQPHVEYLGEANQDEKNLLMGGAVALLVPINWPEPFGLVMIEAMACGAPVIAYKRGSVPELIEEGVTGFIVRDMEEAIQAVEKAFTFDRARCRRRFLERFSASRMTRDYLNIYAEITGAVVEDANITERYSAWTRLSA
ncbi:MAG: glycosyltransferase family 4 protein [Acidobacteria bacterium]|nr:glycosyltransferase family 4 protein [Acidobacteriota bacterium]